MEIEKGVSVVLLYLNVLIPSDNNYIAKMAEFYCFYRSFHKRWKVERERQLWKIENKNTFQS